MRGECNFIVKGQNVQQAGLRFHFFPLCFPRCSFREPSDPFADPLAGGKAIIVVNTNDELTLMGGDGALDIYAGEPPFPLRRCVLPPSPTGALVAALVRNSEGSVLLARAGQNINGPGPLPSQELEKYQLTDFSSLGPTPGLSPSSSSFPRCSVR